MAEYNIDITTAQASIVAKLESITWGFPVTVITDGAIDADEVPKFSDGRVSPFIVVSFGEIQRTGTGRSFAGWKLDNHRSTVDFRFVANNATTPRLMRNILNNELVGWKPDRSGALVKSTALWADVRSYIDAQNRPTRWVANSRFEYGVNAIKVVP